MVRVERVGSTLLGQDAFDEVGDARHASHAPGVPGNFMVQRRS